MLSRGRLPAVQVTARLLLRPWRPGDPVDRAAALGIYSHPEVWPWLGAQPRPCADMAEAGSRLQRWSGLADGVRGIWAIVPFGGPDVPVGATLLLTLPRSDEAESDAVEIGWHLHPASWGRGYATEAAQGMLLRAYAAGWPVVHAVVRPGNDRSLAVCDRLGMRRLGPTRAWYATTTVDHAVVPRPPVAPWGG